VKIQREQAPGQESACGVQHAGIHESDDFLGVKVENSTSAKFSLAAEKLAKGL